MAVKATVETNFGEERELYIRVNNLEASNHGAHCLAKFRGFTSQAKYQEGFGYVWERDIEFSPDIALPLWEQAYNEFKLVIDHPCIDC